MAEETTLIDNIADRTETQVGIIADNISDTAGEVGNMMKESLLSKLDSFGNASPEPPPPPDVSMPEPLAQSHEILKETAASHCEPSGDGQTTLYEQLEQAKQQMAQLGK